MSKLLILYILMLYTPVVFAAGQPICLKGYGVVGCDGVARAKRASFCWQGKVDPKRKASLCKVKEIKAEKKVKKPAQRKVKKLNKKVKASKKTKGAKVMKDK